MCFTDNFRDDYFDLLGAAEEIVDHVDSIHTSDTNYFIFFPIGGYTQHDAIPRANKVIHDIKTV